MCGFLLRKTQNSVQPTITYANIITIVVDNNDTIAPTVRSFSIRRNSSRRLGSERSGSSSSKCADKTQYFTLLELVDATTNFSMENKIVAGSFGVVYKGKLPDGRRVSIKRWSPLAKVKKFQEKETAFESELTLLSWLHHKHLVGFEVVLLELLTGRKAVFRNEEDETGPIGVVEYAIPRLSAGDLLTVVDRRVRVPEIHEAEAVELMAYTTMQCVNLERK
ncbi:hypothetical protein F3Y22_tig00110065pilonHSYRG00197 [Hibiscus syriacus]|uniref:Protein kinase domain-containing protein n=1 Tax=Hibiscus syriacus TaxID=106335 RepID=A0A6A3BJ30_HIBSY|nr:hypothetical protein F3Y22_tig00110065pilonHSYRG00197 [Hibiscus syriacus]